MNAGRHIPTHLEMIHQESELVKHHRKLEEINRHNSKKKVVTDKEHQNKSKLFEVRERNLKFHNSEKAMAIEKDNELLLGRLVEISRKKKGNLFPLKTEANLPRTLNGPSRKKEKDRIALENEAFARRLLSQQPSFNRRKLETDFTKHQERVKNMQRLVAFSPRIKLPPLKANDFETKKPKSGGGKRDHVKLKKKTDKIPEDEGENTVDEPVAAKKNPTDDSATVRTQEKKEPQSSQRKDESKTNLVEESVREEVHEEVHEEEIKEDTPKENVKQESNANLNSANRINPSNNHIQEEQKQQQQPNSGLVNDKKEAGSAQKINSNTHN